MKMEGTIVAVCISEQKGTAKENVGKGCLVTDHGLAGDAHGGKWHRQVSLLAAERVEEFRQRGAAVADGAFGENLLVSGIDFPRLPIGARLHSGDIVLEITQIGKECHSHCAIFHQVGDCIMPREGVFAKVICGGDIGIGDMLYVE